MRTLIYLVLCSSLLLAGCASTGQAGIERSSSTATAAPAKTAPPAPPATVEPTASPTTGGVVLSAYDHSQKGYTLRPVDPTTGEAIPGHTPLLVSHGKEYAPQLAYSQAGSKLAAIESRGDSCEAFAGGVSCYPRAVSLHLIDPAAWQTISATLPADGWAGAVNFSPAADRLAIGYNRAEGSSVLVFDTSNGERLSELELDFRPEQVAFNDNNHLLLYGALPAEKPGITPPGALHLEAISLPSGEVVWEDDLADVTSGNWCLDSCDSEHGMQLYAMWTPAIVLSPDKTLLYIMHADQDKLTRVSLADGSIEEVELREAQSWIERLLAATAGVALAKGGMKGTTRQAVISPDGKTLYVLSSTTDAELTQDGFWESSLVNSELQAIDPQSGQILARTPASGYGIQLSPDGKYLVVDSWTETGQGSEIWTAEGLDHVTRLDGWALAFSPDLDGNIVFLGSRGTNTTTELAWIDPANFQVQGSWKYNGQANWIPAR